MDEYEKFTLNMTGSTHATMEQWQQDQRWQSIKDYVNKIEDLYQMLETTDEITEDNPAFDMLCDFTENLYLVLSDLKAVIYDYESGPNYTELVRQYIKSHISSPYGNSLG